MPTDAPELTYDDASAPFFEGAARGELMLQFCESCDVYMWPVKYRCLHCFAPAVVWRAASGGATLYSLTVVHQAHPRFASPYVLATVETQEGVRFNASLVGENAASIPIGSELIADFDRTEKPFTVPRFRRAS
ncbi:Zn-ribbon domain-containing OB-fold protein [Rhodococcus sp. NPDC059968]|uniref:Zn-ribbon domain-containing OB-fold protein n=1 Tax=Rhodococcus sp. NPDC059968 TaxID=3347017 RepID=UPI00366B1F91